jgi:hypothetical protein
MSIGVSPAAAGLSLQLQTGRHPCAGKISRKIFATIGHLSEKFSAKSFSDGLTLSHAVNAPLPSGPPKISRT